ncbi:MAG: glutamate--tRNA ligase, partial [Candidatus Pacebacteria bacterium]|nr:glutamate--tRNA ligase [Candidatus Paceibacterota bacterium]
MKIKNQKSKIKNIRVRMAPSPTGPLHIGTARTALFNYLFAKKYNGKFILRIEDTDKERSKPEWEEGIINGLHWLGIDWDEGPNKKGIFEPYRQSQRTEIYKKYIEKLLADKNAYWCFCSPEEIEAFKQERLSMGKPPIYKCHCSDLTAEEVVEKQKNQPNVGAIRFKTPKTEVSFEDLSKGKITYDGSLFGDMVIAKNLNEPLYNLACVVDDFEMQITHIIRGEDHISNTPKQILLAKALGIDSPKFLHLPLILGPDKTKLSKRHGATTSIDDYKKQGYLPEAIINFIAFLGWNPGGKEEIFSLKELENEFSIEKIQKSGAIFNAQKLDFLNGYFIRKMPLEKLTELCLPYLIDTGLTSGGVEEISKIAPMVALYQERLKKISEIPELIDFFFKENLNYEKELLRWKKTGPPASLREPVEDPTFLAGEALRAGESELLTRLDKLLNTLSNINEPDWTKEKLNEIIVPIANGPGDRPKILRPM